MNRETETDISAEQVKENQRVKETPILTDSRSHCCKPHSRGASAPTTNQQSRSGAMLSSGVGVGDTRRHRTETISQPEEPVMKRSQRKRQSQIAEKEHNSEELGRRRAEDLAEVHLAEQSDRNTHQDAEEHSQHQVKEHRQ